MNKLRYIILVILLVVYGIAFAIMYLFDGDWGDFIWYSIWGYGIALAYLAHWVIALIILIYFLYNKGLINIIAWFFGPIGWAVGSTLGWYDD